MSLVKCPYCPVRTREKLLGTHLRRCLPYRKKLRADRLQIEEVIPEKPKKEKKAKKMNAIQKAISAMAILFLFVIPMKAQDATLTMDATGYWDTTMTGVRDTFDIVPGNKRFECYTITAKATGADTLTVETLSFNESIWSQHALQDLASGSNVTSVIASTTAKEFLILDPQIRKMRFVVTDADTASISVVVQGKKYYR